MGNSNYYNKWRKLERKLKGQRDFTVMCHRDDTDTAISIILNVLNSIIEDMEKLEKGEE